MQRHFLQSKLWADFQACLGNEIFHIEKQNFEILAILKKTTFGNYIYCPYGPNLTSEDSLGDAVKELKNLMNKTNSLFARIEPTLKIGKEKMQACGLLKSYDLNPDATWILDLEQDEKVLLSGIEKERTRYWRGRDRRGMKIRVSKDAKDIDILYDFMKANADANDYVGETKDYLIKELEAPFAMLYVLELEVKCDDGTTKLTPLAASLMFDDDDTRFYGHSANNPKPEYRKLRANGVLLVQAILDAKNEGKKKFDFWGITLSEDKNHPWAGFTKFKKSFSGYPVQYSGTWDLPSSKMKYQLYTTLRKVNRTIRRLRYHK